MLFGLRRQDFLEHRLDGNGMGTMIWGHAREMGVTILEEVFLEWRKRAWQELLQITQVIPRGYSEGLSWSSKMS
eukprot:6303857-Pyramimonas_sp.AAC.1